MTCCSFSQLSAYHRSAVNVTNITQYACLHICTFTLYIYSLLFTLSWTFILYFGHRRTTVFVLVNAQDGKALLQSQASIYCKLYVYFFFSHTHRVSWYYQSFHSPTDVQINCLKNSFIIYIKIDIKTDSTCFGSVTMMRERIIRAC